MTDRLARMKELEAKATQGRWRVSGLNVFADSEKYAVTKAFACKQYRRRDVALDNALYIAELRNAAKDLIELVEEARTAFELTKQSRQGFRYVDDDGAVIFDSIEWLSKLSEFQNEGVGR